MYVLVHVVHVCLNVMNTDFLLRLCLSILYLIIAPPEQSSPSCQEANAGPCLEPNIGEKEKENAPTPAPVIPGIPDDKVGEQQYIVHGIRRVSMEKVL